MSTRRSFIMSTAAGSAGLILPPVLVAQQQQSPPALPVETVKEFVIAGHRNLERVKEMLNENPNLIFCKYDWGDGDFEEAAEGAGHLGNKEIANYLIGQGARVNLFILTMLGKTELVKPVLEQYPKLVFAKGPHGFTLLHHAKVGGKDSQELHEFLLAQGLSDYQINIR